MRGQDAARAEAWRIWADHDNDSSDIDVFRAGWDCATAYFDAKVTADPLHDPCGRPPIGDLIDQTLEKLVADAYAAGQAEGRVGERERIRQALLERQAMLAYISTSRQVAAVLVKDITDVLDGAS